MTTDYERGIEDAAKAVEHMRFLAEQEEAPALVAGLSAALKVIRSLAPAQGVEQHECTAACEVRGCAGPGPVPAPPLVHVDDGQGFRGEVPMRPGFGYQPLPGKGGPVKPPPRKP